MAQEDSTDNESMQGEEEWEDWEDDGNEIGLVKCLFSDDVFASAEEAMRYDAKENDFDLEAVRSKVLLLLCFEIREIPLRRMRKILFCCSYSINLHFMIQYGSSTTLEVK